MTALFIQNPCQTYDGDAENFDDIDYTGKWFGDLTASFTNSLKGTIPQTRNALEDLAGIIQRSANALATELSNFEREAGKEAKKWADNLYESDQDQDYYGQNITLPWQIEEELHIHDDSENHDQNLEEKSSLRKSNLVEDLDLKSEILMLSTKESTFTQPFSNDRDESKENNVDDNTFSFELDSHMILIQRLLQMDRNLRNAHARLSTIKVNEQFFWKNYFFHCADLKKGRDLVKIELKCAQDETDGDNGISDVGKNALSENVKSRQNSNSTPINDLPVSKEAKLELLRTFSMDDMVLVGGENEELDRIASDFS